MKARLLWIIWFLFLPAMQAFAEPPPSLDDGAFARLPVLHDGRVKPVDSYARALLGRLHGEGNLKGITASEWLAETLFSPEAAMQRSFIPLPDPKLADVLGLAPQEQKNATYSYAELAPAFDARKDIVVALLQKNNNALTGHERAFLDLYLAIHDYAQTLQALTLILPVQVEADPDYLMGLGVEAQRPSYLELVKAKARITAQARAAAETHGGDLVHYSDEEQQAALLAFQLARLEASGEGNTLFRIIPDFLGHPREWYAPWALLRKGHGSPQGSALLGEWRNLAEAYEQGDSTEWNGAVQRIMELTRSAREPAGWQLTLEVLYHALDPVLWVMAAYLAAWLLCLGGRTRPFLYRLARSLLYGGFILHVLMIASRIAILGRPPVSTLYESILFVSLIAVFSGLMMDRRKESHEGGLLAASLGAGLLFVSQLFAAQGDTLGVVIAVLNTHFWLATHVICITIGYGTSLLAGSMAHLYLLKPSPAMGQRLRTAALIALLFTAIGTILGGIWADQSWGRFWGWDPKENGALAIVLWLVWAVHGRISGHFKAVGFATVLALTNIVVALSWFGVNLLGVGLHSYGFTDKAAYGLGGFCLLEMIVIGLLAYRTKRMLAV